MSAPVPAVAGLVWGIAGVPLLAYAATRVQRGRRNLHATLMLACVTVELAVFVGFMFLMDPSPRRAELQALPLFTIHLAFAVATFAGIAWQLTTRKVPRLRWLHRATGPYVVLVWCLALLTGIYNYVFLYILDVR